MTIKSAKYPEAGLEILMTALADMEFGADKLALGGRSEQQISEPIPVYTLDLKTAMNGVIPEDFVPASWRYLLTDDQNISAADVTSSDSGHSAGEFNRITQGAIVDRFNSALSYVDVNFSSSTDDYEVRALEIPAINEAAIWLHSDSVNIFIPYLDATRLKGGPPEIEEHFLDQIAENAQQIARDGSN